MRLSAFGPSWKSGCDFENHEVLVQPCINARRDPLAERVIEDRINDRRVDAELLSELAVDLDFQDPAGALLVGRDVGQLRQRLQFL